MRAEPATATKPVRCAIYTRKSVAEGLDQEFNTLDAQREAAEAFIASQRYEGWVALPQEFIDGGFTGANIDRPGIQKLLHAVENDEVDCIVVYKIDRLSRSLLDFARIIELLEKHNCSFVSVTQQFNTKNSMGRLTLNILLSFAQFEREIIAERTRDKIVAARKKGKWTGGYPVLGYDIGKDKKLALNPAESEIVRQIYELYIRHEAVLPVVQACRQNDWLTKAWISGTGRRMGGQPFNKPRLYSLLSNPLYLGKIRAGSELTEGEHTAIIDEGVFAKVRSLLDRNWCSRGGNVRNKHGALLKGLLYDAKTGYAMAHTFTKKGNRLYRYYVSTQAAKEGWETCRGASFPASEIESFVVENICQMGEDPELQRAVMQETDTFDQPVQKEELLEAMSSFDPCWNEMAPRERTRLVELVIEKILVDSEAGKLAIQFRPSGIRALLNGGKS